MNKFEQFISTIENYHDKYEQDITTEKYFSFPMEPILTVEESLRAEKTKNIAYFSMEFGIAPSIYHTFRSHQPLSKKNQFYKHDVFSNNWLCDYLFKIKIDKLLDIPIYGGGLGVLAGDAMKSSADHGFSVAGIGILWNKGYFKQNFWYKHGQMPEELAWEPRKYPGLIPCTNIITLETKEGPLHLRIWKYYIYSYDKKQACPLILLDSNLKENSDHFQKLTDQLYRSDDVWWKIFQRVILGIGGIKALESLGYNIHHYHLNEGHAAFALVEKYMQLANKEDFKEFQNRFAYTCHTPVAAGHDRFHADSVRKVLTDEYTDTALKLGREPSDPNVINLTEMCLENCNKVNAVAQKHGEITRLQFPQFAEHIQAITNGVHMHTWMTSSFKNLLDEYKSELGDWRRHPENLVHVEKLKSNSKFRKQIVQAHQENKAELIHVTGRWHLQQDVLTIGWARRIAGYKRPSLIFHDVNQILNIAREHGPLQIILAGKAHPNDNIGSAHIDQILDSIDKLNDYTDLVKVLILENYDTFFGKLLSSSVDIWLNNPLPPFEASGTSGMKAIMNGVLQLSTLDGWVVEAANDDIGWIFGYQHQGSEIGGEMDSRMDEDSKALYANIAEIAQLYYKTYDKGQINLESPWIDKMINCIKRSAFFNTQRMMSDYDTMMWQPVTERAGQK